MNGYEISDIVKESISLGILFFVLLKASGIAFKLLSMVDAHLSRFLSQVDFFLIILAEIRDGRTREEK